MDLYNEEINQVSILEEYLPKQMGEEEISIEIDKLMTETGSTIWEF
jgi:uncharacterized protein YqeY